MEDACLPAGRGDEIFMAIDPIKDIVLAQVPGVRDVRGAGTSRALPVNPFEDILGKAVDSLEGVSQAEFTANDLISKYVAGSAELSDVMVATSKMSIAVQLAVTVINSAVASFKELTQMQM